MVAVSTIIDIVFILMSVFLAGYVVILRKRINSLHSEILDLAVQKEIILEKLADALNTIESKPVEQTDGFLKFITESRDYAFEFINTMQESINEFENTTKDIFDKSEVSEDIEIIKKAYLVLKEKTMPNDIPNN